MVSHRTGTKKVLIIGGGIAGIALANFLQDSDWDITITERASGWRTIGFGVGIWINGLKILQKLNLGESFWSKTTLIAGGAVVDISGRMIFEIPASKLGVSEMARTVERDVLHKALTRRFSDKVTIRFNTDFADIKQLSDKVEVTFKDGSAEQFDVVVGADGIRSEVRQKIFGDHMKSYGWTAHVYWAEKTVGLYDDYYIATDHRKIFLNMPSGDRCVIGFGYINGEHRNPIEKEPEQLLEEFSALSPQMKEVVESIDHSKGMFQDRLDYVSLKRWHKGNIVLIGDAKHGLSPVSGFGTSLALEDGYALSEALKENLPIQHALKKFAKTRNRDLRNIGLFARIMEAGLLAKSRLPGVCMRVFPTSFVISLLKKALAV
jgi:2-polyprenyl-6-methoxyphenol hydroxylase-like FAD-dependent oxidoreductase